MRIVFWPWMRAIAACLMVFAGYAAAGPLITGISPGIVEMGGPGFTLTVDGSGFGSDALVLLDGSALQTTFVSSTRLTAVIPASMIATTGYPELRVLTGGQTSNPWVLAVEYPIMISSFSPSPVTAGSGAFVLTLNGQKFTPNTTVSWNDQPIAATYVSSTKLTVQVPAQLIAIAGNMRVTVNDPVCGGCGSGTTLPVVPGVVSLSPPSIPAGSPGLVVTMTGSGFGRDSSVYWNYTGLPTTYVNSTTLTFTVPANLIATAGNATIRVSSGGAYSRDVLFDITSGLRVTSLTPGGAGAGLPSMDLSVNGGGFSPGAVILWNSSPLATTFVSSTKLTTVVPGTLLNRAGTVRVSVSSGGMTSNAVDFPIYAAAGPSLSSISPSFAQAGGPGFTLTANGAGFVSGAAVKWEGTPLSTTFVNDTQLSAIVPANLIVTAGTAVVSVSSGGTGTAGLTFTISGSSPANPVISSLQPASVAEASAGFTLTVLGQGFSPGAAVRWSGTALVTTFVDPTRLTAAVPAHLVYAVGTAAVTVAQGSYTSGPATFTITPYQIPPPQIESVSPASAVAGGAGFTITVNGWGYEAGAVVKWNGTPLTTSYVSPLRLTASVPAALIAAAGTAQVTVSVGTRTSGNMPFLIASAVTSNPSITSLSPPSMPAGSGAFTLTVTGANFLPGTAVMWNGVPLATTYVSASSLMAAVSAPLVASAGVNKVSVSVGGFTTTGIDFNVTASAAVIGSISPSSATAGSAGFPLTVFGSGFEAGSSVTWNGTALATTFVTSGHLTAAVPGYLVANPGGAQVEVVKGAARTNALIFEIVANGVLSGIEPVSAPEGAAGITLTVSGSGFVTGCKVTWSGIGLETTYVSAGVLRAAVPAGLLSVAGEVWVGITQCGDSTARAKFTVTAGPRISRLDPDSVPAGSGAFRITVEGGAFESNAVAMWNGTSLQTAFVSTSRVMAEIPANLLEDWGVARIAVSSGGRASNGVDFRIVARPHISSVSPETLSTWMGSAQITITGSGFGPDAKAMWNGAAMVTAFVSKTELRAIVDAGRLQTPGQAQVAVLIGGVTSNAATVEVAKGPILQSLSPRQMKAGAAEFTLEVSGEGFAAGSTVLWNEQSLATEYSGPTLLKATVAAHCLAAPGVVRVSVVNSDLSESGHVEFAVVPEVEATLSLERGWLDAPPTEHAAVSLRLKEAAPVTMHGTLNLRFRPDAEMLPEAFVDPAAGFMAGGLSASFEIPAGAQEASIALNGWVQPGTVAGTFVVGLSSLQVGPGSAMPEMPPAAEFSVARAAPVIVPGSVVVKRAAGPGLEVELDGYSTTREMREAVVVFESRDGQELAGVTADLQEVLTRWYGSEEGRWNGGVFHLRFPVEPGVDAVKIASIRVVLANSIGKSDPAAARLSF